MSIKQLKSIEDLNAFIQQPGKHLLFKHSTACPVSAEAYGEFRAFLRESDTSAAEVLVIEDRPVSNKIAEQFGVKHESPQIFLLEDGKVLWHASHWRITQQSITEALNQ